MKKLLLTLSIFMFAVLSVNSQALPATYTATNIVTTMRYPADFDWTPDGRYIYTQKGDNTFPAAQAYIRMASSSGVGLGIYYDLTDSVDSDCDNCNKHKHNHSQRS